MRELNKPFENSWKEAFTDAEMIPSYRVWENIDSTLTKDENAIYRKRFLVWQLVAAASIVFAIGTIAINYLSHKPIEKKTEITSSKESTNSQKENSTSNITPEKSEESIPQDIKKEKERVNISQNDSKSAVNAVAKTSSEDSSIKDNSSLTVAYNNSRLMKIGSPDFSRVSIQMLDIHKFHYYPEVKEEKPAENYPIWAGLKMAGGSSGSLSTSGGMAKAAVADPNTDFGGPGIDNTSKPGIGYSLGLVAGKRISKKLYLQSGLQYLVQNTRGTTNAYYQNSTNQAKEPLFLYNTESIDTSRGSVFSTTTTEVTSTIEYVSIPIQVGYLIIDRRIDWGISAGISSDFFTRNIVSDNSGELDKIIIRNGNNSPFRPVNFSALVSTELNYDISDNYSVSLEPRYSIAINPVTKKELNVDDRRLRAFTIGLKLRYLF